MAMDYTWPAAGAALATTGQATRAGAKRNHLEKLIQSAATIVVLSSTITSPS